MKQASTKLAALMVRASLRINGWTDVPKPHPYVQSEKYPWWRRMGNQKIEASDMIGAFKKQMEGTKP